MTSLNCHTHCFNDETSTQTSVKEASKLPLATCAAAAPAAAQAAALGNTRNTVKKSANKPRENRYRRRAEGQRIAIKKLYKNVEQGLEDGTTYVNQQTGEIKVNLPRLAKCSWCINQEVYIRGGDGEKASWSGTIACGNIWLCPVCSAVIRYRRAQEITQAVKKWQSEGKGLLFLTLTIRHNKNHALADLLQVLQEAYRILYRSTDFIRSLTDQNSSKIWKISATEITVGDNGFHPHKHIIMFMPRKYTPVEVEKIKQTMFNAWKIAVRKASKKIGITGVTPALDRHGRGGVDLQCADENGQALACYLSKIQEKNIALEVAGTDGKKGRNGNITPFDLLEVPADESDKSRAHREKMWLEYAQAMRGKHALDWSTGMKEYFGIIDITDEQIVEDKRANGDIKYAIVRADYAILRKNPAKHAMAIDLAEIGAWKMLDRLTHGRKLTSDEAEIIEKKLHLRE